MSSRDALNTINGSFHGQDGKKIGFYMYKLASHEDGIITYNDSIFPMCGPLLFVVNNNRRRTLDLDISFKYKQATEAGYKNSSVRGMSTKQMTYTEGTSWIDGSITLERSEQSYYEKLYKSAYDEPITRNVNFYGEYTFQKDNNTIDYIYELDDISVSHNDADWEVFVLATTGARVVNGFSFNEMREQGDNITRSFFAAPRICPLCEGKKVYPVDSESITYDQYNNMIPLYIGATCPECNGFGYSGFNASGDTLTLKGFDTGITRSYADDDDILQRYIWAEKWWFYPTIPALKNFISFFTRIKTDEITIIQYIMTDTEITYTGDFEYTSEFLYDTGTVETINGELYHYAPESYLDIKIPITELEASGYDIKFVEDIIKNKLPVGTSYKVSAFNVFSSGGDLDNEFSVLNKSYISGETYKTDMLYEGRGSMYNWCDGLKGVYDSATWEGTTNTGTSDQIGSIYQYGATPSSYMAKGSAFNVNDSSSVGIGGPLSDTLRTTGQGANFFKDVLTSKYNDNVSYDNFWAELETTGTVSFVR